MAGGDLGPRKLKRRGNQIEIGKKRQAVSLRDMHVPIPSVVHSARHWFSIMFPLF